MADAGHHGERQHDQADVPVPAVPGAGLVVVEAKLVFGGLEAVLDGPAPPLDRGKRCGARAGRAPGCEIGALAVSQLAPDQQPARPGS